MFLKNGKILKVKENFGLSVLKFLNKCDILKIETVFYWILRKF